MEVTIAHVVAREDFKVAFYAKLTFNWPQQLGRQLSLLACGDAATTCRYLFN